MSELIVAGTSTPVSFSNSFPFTLWSAHPTLHTRPGWSWAPPHMGISQLAAGISPTSFCTALCFWWDGDGLFPNPEDTTGIKMMKILIKKKIITCRSLWWACPRAGGLLTVSAAGRREHRRVLVSRLQDVGSTSPSLWLAVLGKVLTIWETETPFLPCLRRGAQAEAASTSCFCSTPSADSLLAL